MGLKNLKSAFSNIKEFSEAVEKTTKEISSKVKTNLINMVSQYSIQPNPQEINYISNTKSVGFSSNQNSQSPTSLFTGIFNKNMNWINNSIYGTMPIFVSSEINYMGDEKVVGFSANQKYMSQSKFTGVGGESPNMIFDSNTIYYTNSDHGDWPGIQKNGITLDGSLYGLPNLEPQQINFMDDDKVEGFTANLESNSNSKIVGINNEKWTWAPTTDTYNIGGIDFPGPVDFMTGLNSYYTEINPITNTNPSSGISGFTNNFTAGGYIFGTGEKGNSKFLKRGITPEGEEIIFATPTGTHTGYHSSGIVFEGGSYSFDNGMPASGDTNWTNLETYYDSIHTTNAIEKNIFGPVNFMSGLSLHPDSVEQGSTFVISGFDNNYDPGLFGGWSIDSQYGDSKLLSMWAQEEEGKPMKTSLYTGYLGEVTNATIEFPGPVGAHGTDLTLNRGDVSFPGGYSADSTLGSSEFLETDDDGNNIMIPTVNHTIVGYGGSDSFSGNLNFDGTNLFNWNKITLMSGAEVDPSKGKNAYNSPSDQFNLLYNNDNTVKSETDEDGLITTTKYLGPPQDGSSINAISKFSLSGTWNTGLRTANKGSKVLALSSFGMGNINVDEFQNSPNGEEPYIINFIGDRDHSSVFHPISRLQKDTVRISKFLSSAKGSDFILNQNIMGTFQYYRPYYDPGSTLLNTALPSEGLGFPAFHFPRDYGITGAIIDLINNANTYSEWLDTRALGFSIGGGMDVLKAEEPYAVREESHKPLAFLAGDLLASAASSVINALIPGGDSAPASIDKGGIDKSSGIDSKRNMQNSMDSRTSPLGSIGKGDSYTLTPISVFDESDIDSADVVDTDQTDGMPFYFRDLRDGAVIFFRAYLEGLSDSISPSWNSENYVGRSEPVYTYTNAEREVGFTLKLFAGTKDELNQIYHKLNRLTSLCYPEYKKFEFGNNAVETDGANSEKKPISPGSGRIMMKPPLVKLRLGELFGSQQASATGKDKTLPSSAEMVGFIKSLSYTFPDNAPWEIQEGYRVPKMIEASITYQVIHSEVPSLDFAIKNKDQSKSQTFYGINQTLYENMKGNGTFKRKKVTSGI